MSNDLVVSELKGREVARLDRLAEQARAFIEAAKAGNGEQQQPGGAESNMLILWRRGCIHSKTTLKNIGLCEPDDSPR